MSNYFHSLSQTPHRLKSRVLARWTPDQEVNQVRLRSGADMKRKLRWFDLVSLGVGGMLGVGVFVTTGPVARDISGPAVFISYIVAGFSALLSSLCYTEFSVNVPVAGGAFSYLRVTFGEFIGYFGGVNILLEYVLSNAAVARSFTEYLCTAFGVSDPNAWRIKVNGLAKGYNELDFSAVALVLLLTLCLCHSTKESSMLNLVMTVFHVIFFGFVIIAGFCHGDGVKALVEPRGLTPYGVRGVVNGAAVVYFSYIGYDTVSTLAEEIQNPSFSLPVGIIGSVSVVSVLYCLMSLVLCIMVPYNEISKSASYAVAFRRIGWGWAGNVVGAGASLGIVASLLVAMLGQARYLCVIGRARLVPSWLAKVHPSTGTPLNATLFLGLCTATIALFTDLEIVMELISLGTLCVFYLVANALLYRKYTLTGQNAPFHTLSFLALLSFFSLAFSLWWKLNKPWWGLTLFMAITIAVTAFFQYHTWSISSTANKNLLPPYTSKWSVPFMPWPAAISVFLNVFLATTLKTLSFQRFAIWTCLVTMFYVLYGVHRTYEAEEMGRVEDGRVEDVGIHVTSSRVQPEKLDNVQMEPKKYTLDAAAWMTSEAMSIVVDVNRVSDINQDGNTHERIKKAAQDGDIERLYKLVAEDPYILKHFRKVPFCETPLHIAAEKGQTHFAMELVTLKPSLALKLNASGFSPMHLALQNNHTGMARGFLAIDSSLVSIKGRGRITPLHHVALFGDAELLGEFLCSCPSSIEDLTIKRETAIHIAVKNHRFDAFKVLLGWVKRVNREEVLDWKDEDGNTVLHIAASTNQTQVVKLLRGSVKVKAKNLDGKTAMDILQTHQSPLSPEASNSIFQSTKERLLSGPTTTLATYLSKKPSFIEKWNNAFGLTNLSKTRQESLNSEDSRSVILVVAVLIVTATYQANLSPPGGFWQDDSKPGDRDTHLAGQMTMSFYEAIFFYVPNGIAFFLSLYVIMILTVGLPMWKVVYGSIATLGIANFAMLNITFPNYTARLSGGIILTVFLYSYPAITGLIVFAPFVVFFLNKRRRRRVDFPARYFSSPHELS